MVSYPLLIAVNVASNSGILGPTNADISQRYSTPLTPAGYVALALSTKHATQATFALPRPVRLIA